MRPDYSRALGPSGISLNALRCFVTDGRATSNRVPEGADLLAAWVREAADELDKAHAILDEAGVPRAREEGIAMTLAARIYTLIESTR
jgi:hypothetical protein